MEKFSLVLKRWAPRTVSVDDATGDVLVDGRLCVAHSEHGDIVRGANGVLRLGPTSQFRAAPGTALDIEAFEETLVEIGWTQSLDAPAAVPSVGLSTPSSSSIASVSPRRVQALQATPHGRGGTHTPSPFASAPPPWATHDELTAYATRARRELNMMLHPLAAQLRLSATGGASPERELLLHSWRPVLQRWLHSAGDAAALPSDARAGSWLGPAVPAPPGALEELSLGFASSLHPLRELICNAIDRSADAENSLATNEVLEAQRALPRSAAPAPAAARRLIVDPAETKAKATGDGSPTASALTASARASASMSDAVEEVMLPGEEEMPAALMTPTTALREDQRDVFKRLMREADDATNGTAAAVPRGFGESEGSSGEDDDAMVGGPAATVHVNRRGSIDIVPSRRPANVRTPRTAAKAARRNEFRERFLASSNLGAVPAPPPPPQSGLTQHKEEEGEKKEPAPSLEPQPQPPVPSAAQQLRGIRELGLSQQVTMSPRLEPSRSGGGGGGGGGGGSEQPQLHQQRRQQRSPLDSAFGGAPYSVTLAQHHSPAAQAYWASRGGKFTSPQAANVFTTMQRRSPGALLGDQLDLVDAPGMVHAPPLSDSYSARYARGASPAPNSPFSPLPPAALLKGGRGAWTSGFRGGSRTFESEKRATSSSPPPPLQHIAPREASVSPPPQAVEWNGRHSNYSVLHGSGSRKRGGGRGGGRGVQAVRSPDGELSFGFGGRKSDGSGVDEDVDSSSANDANEGSGPEHWVDGRESMSWRRGQPKSQRRRQVGRRPQRRPRAAKKAPPLPKQQWRSIGGKVQREPMGKMDRGNAASSAETKRGGGRTRNRRRKPSADATLFEQRMRNSAAQREQGQGRGEVAQHKHTAYEQQGVETRRKSPLRPRGAAEAWHAATIGGTAATHGSSVAAPDVRAHTVDASTSPGGPTADAATSPLDRPSHLATHDITSDSDGLGGAKTTLPSGCRVSKSFSKGGAVKLGNRIALDDGSHGIARFIGSVDFARGEWIGVELEYPMGRNTGSVDGVKYFHCAQNNGLSVGLKYAVFVRSRNATVISPGRSGRSSPGGRSRGSPSSQRSSPCHSPHRREGSSSGSGVHISRRGSIEIYSGRSDSRPAHSPGRSPDAAARPPWQSPGSRKKHRVGAHMRSPLGSTDSRQSLDRSVDSPLHGGEHAMPSAALHTHLSAMVRKLRSNQRVQMTELKTAIKRLEFRHGRGEEASELAGEYARLIQIAGDDHVASQLTDDHPRTARAHRRATQRRPRSRNSTGARHAGDSDSDGDGGAENWERLGAHPMELPVQRSPATSETISSLASSTTASTSATISTSSTTAPHARLRGTHASANLLLPVPQPQPQLHGGALLATQRAQPSVRVNRHGSISIGGAPSVGGGGGAPLQPPSLGGAAAPALPRRRAPARPGRAPPSRPATISRSAPSSSLSRAPPSQARVPRRTQQFPRSAAPTRGTPGATRGAAPPRVPQLGGAATGIPAASAAAQVPYPATPGVTASTTLRALLVLQETAQSLTAELSADSGLSLEQRGTLSRALETTQRRQSELLTAAKIAGVQLGDAGVPSSSYVTTPPAATPRNNNARAVTTTPNELTRWLGEESTSSGAFIGGRHGSVSGAGGEDTDSELRLRTDRLESELEELKVQARAMAQQLQASSLGGGASVASSATPAMTLPHTVQAPVPVETVPAAPETPKTLSLWLEEVPSDAAVPAVEKEKEKKKKKKKEEEEEEEEEESSNDPRRRATVMKVPSVPVASESNIRPDDFWESDSDDADIDADGDDDGDGSGTKKIVAEAPPVSNGAVAQKFMRPQGVAVASAVVAPSPGLSFAMVGKLKLKAKAMTKKLSAPIATLRSTSEVAVNRWVEAFLMTGWGDGREAKAPSPVRTHTFFVSPIPSCE